MNGWIDARIPASAGCVSCEQRSAARLVDQFEHEAFGLYADAG
jgi:hypothetical protein